MISVGVILSVVFLPLNLLFNRNIVSIFTYSSAVTDYTCKLQKLGSFSVGSLQKPAVWFNSDATVCLVRTVISYALPTSVVLALSAPLTHC